MISCYPNCSALEILQGHRSPGIPPGQGFTSSWKVAAFWAAALERPIDQGASEFFTTIDAEEPGPARFFIKVPEGKTVKNRMHTDFHSTDRQTEVERLVALGASVIAEQDQWGARWTVPADPEGNEFCGAEMPG